MSVFIGKFLLAHLGDSICTTPLARYYFEQGEDVFVHDNPNYRVTYENNPYIKGYKKYGRNLLLKPPAKIGHVIQRIQKSTKAEISTVPRPELYLSTAEAMWAETQKSLWPTDKPICLIAKKSQTDYHLYKNLDWANICKILSDKFNFLEVLIEDDGQEAPENFDSSAEFYISDEGVITYRNLHTRNYIALFSVIDQFCGLNSGGSHVAAAFNVPSIIIMDNGTFSKIKFPCTLPIISSKTFLYPYHKFLKSEELQKNDFDGKRLESLFD